MSEITFEDNLVYPKEKETIHFEGEEPFRLYSEIRNIFKDVFVLAGKDVFEKVLKWDATAPNKTFYSKFEINRKIDSWTKLEVTVVFQGCQNSDTRKGSIAISIVPVFKTTVETGFFLKTFWWIYYFIYYKKKRLHDFYYAKNLVNKFKLEIGKLYGIPNMESF